MSCVSDGDVLLAGLFVATIVCTLLPYLYYTVLYYEYMSPSYLLDLDLSLALSSSLFGFPSFLLYYEHSMAVLSTQSPRSSIPSQSDSFHTTALECFLRHRLSASACTDDVF